jgi:hypothetical protein
MLHKRRLGADGLALLRRFESTAVSHWDVTKVRLLSEMAVWLCCDVSSCCITYHWQVTSTQINTCADPRSEMTK